MSDRRQKILDEGFNRLISGVDSPSSNISWVRGMNEEGELKWIEHYYENDAKQCHGCPYYYREDDVNFAMCKILDGDNAGPDACPALNEKHRRDKGEKE